MKYLKEFQTAAQYAAAESSLALPNVSLITETNGVAYKPLQPTPPTPSHDYVEIGGKKWATMNVGAESITDYGNYYQYGKGADQYAATSGQSDYAGTENPLDSSVDTVVQEWGGNWRMPTKSEMDSLWDNTISGWTSSYEGSGVAGMILTSKTDSNKKLFFPASGYYSNGTLKSRGTYTCLWSSTPFYDEYAYELELGEISMVLSRVFRHSGSQVRGVLDE